MRVKVLMRWDIDSNKESEYYDFVVNEFIPRAKRLGLANIQFWYTTYGNCEQIQASGITNSQDQMQNILRSEDWSNLTARLNDLVRDYDQKVIAATDGFQL